MEIKSQKLKRDIKKTQKEITIRLGIELEKDKKTEEKLQKDADFERFFRESQGRSVVEARTSKYVSKITSNHVDIIDSTGRSSLIDIQPSQITVSNLNILKESAAVIWCSAYGISFLLVFL